MTGVAQSSLPLPKGPPEPTATASSKQLARRAFVPPLPAVFSASALSAVRVEGESLLNEQDKQMNAPFSVSAEDAQILRDLFPNTIDTPFLKLVSGSATADSNKPLKVGVVLSGGQAAGGHNVICGVFDYIKRVNASSVLYGFLGGPHGVYSGEYRVLDGETIDQYRNMGGFDMIKSGRHKIETDAQKQASLEVCKKLQLDGLVVIGGDDSNTNAAILAEYFKAHGSATQVVGCPKTIDGDLKNYFVEISFGFDTACRTYSCSIGNLMMQTMTQRNVYQFVRLMGRSASLLTLECALRCHPNMTFIGEEVLAKKQSLKQLVAMTADLVEARAKIGKLYGVILLPEGLIEFIPEVGVLIGEINTIVAVGEFDKAKLTPESRAVLEMLPAHTQQQLLLDRDPHGNVQVALIHTEQLLLELTMKELQNRSFQHTFQGRCTYLGYEGRSGFPSDFDASYCYGLGNVAAALIQNKATSCMAVLKGMSCSSDIKSWQPAGIPLTRMMNLENRKGKANVPVIKKFLVDIEKPLFKAFEQVRGAWKILDLYRVPGPMQLDEEQPQLPYTLTGPPPLEKLLPAAALAAFRDPAKVQKGYRLYFDLLEHLRSPLQQAREAAPIEAPEQLRKGDVTLTPASVVELLQPQQQQQMRQIFPRTAASQGGLFAVSPGVTESPKVGLVLVGEATPGLSNVALGIMEKVVAAGGDLVGVAGKEGGFNTSLLQFKKDFEMQRNLNGLPLLGRTVLEEQQLLADGGALCKSAGLDVLIVLGGTFTGCATLAEQLEQRGDKCKVLSVCGGSDFCMFDPTTSLEKLQRISATVPGFNCGNERRIACQKTQDIICDASGALGLGFDTQTKAAAELVGNLMTDSNSAAKYFYFCKVGGGRGAEAEVALQTHPNICLLSTVCANLTPVQVAEKIATCVEARCAQKKNFGVLILNEDMFITNKALRSVAIALAVNGGNAAALSGNEAAVFQTIPQTFQEKLTKTFRTPCNFPVKAASFPILDCLAAMVSKVLKDRKAAGSFSGSFSPICFDLSDQVRGSFPSAYDCALGYTLGLMCGTLAVSPSLKQLSSSAVFVSNPTAQVASFAPLVVPLAAAAMTCGLTASTRTSENGIAACAAAGAFDLQLNTPTQAVAVSAVHCDMQQKEFLLKDSYLNSGPLQFRVATGAADADRECNYILSSRH
ncbi:uncharacterized protein LOC34617665 [Cyclospora cayetanensis]|uniref:Pyrophosphate--fructose 6-phosphate 1-phosphotransferase n=1 Tax=Cyclospora cayetanensis TaxID=88456 RepID=A0A6P6RZV7_9EIME|nr:uncharacterized protein LOC34617665 [Cyclospora cayetanensis]